jgi:hypothetical protein
MGGKEATMIPYELAHLYRADQLEEAEFQRWLRRVGPLRPAKERFSRRLVRRAWQWVVQQARSLACKEALPACGLSPSA